MDEKLERPMIVESSLASLSSAMSAVFAGGRGGIKLSNSS